MTRRFSDVLSADGASAGPADQPVRGRRRRRLRRFTGRDIACSRCCSASRSLLDLALIWATTLASIGLSFTNYNGVTAIKWVGMAQLRHRSSPSTSRSGARSATTCCGWASSA